MGGEGELERSGDGQKRIIVFKTLSTRIISVSSIRQGESLPSSLCVWYLSVSCVHVCEQYDFFITECVCECDASLCSLHLTLKAAIMFNHLRARSRSLFSSYKPGSRTQEVKETVEHLDLISAFIKPWNSMQVSHSVHLGFVWFDGAIFKKQIWAIPLDFGYVLFRFNKFSEAETASMVLRLLCFFSIEPHSSAQAKTLKYKIK